MNWVSVKDRLPVKEKSYIVYGGFGSGNARTLIIEYKNNDGEWGFWLPAETGYEWHRVTHWMEVPGGPELDLIDTCQKEA